MYSRELHRLIRKHDYSLFGGTVARLKDLYGASFSHVAFRKPRHPLIDHKVNGQFAAHPDSSPTAYTIIIDPDGNDTYTDRHPE